MPISNVALNNTFNEWRVRTNEVIVAMNDVLNDGLVTYRNITANVITANNLLFSSGANVVAVLNSSFDKANTGVRTGWTTLVANNPISQVSITPASNNDTLTLRTTGNVSITGVSANDNVIFDLTDTTVTAGSYGSSSAVPVITVDSKGRLTTVTTASIDTATAVSAFDKANSAVRTGWTTIVANTPTSEVSITPTGNNDTLTLRTTGNVSIVGVSANDNVIFDLTTTGVTARTYGNSTIIPVLIVDSRGRLTSVTNTTIDLSSTVLKTGNTMTGNLVMSGANVTFVGNYSGMYWTDRSFVQSPASDIISFGVSQNETMRLSSVGLNVSGVINSTSGGFKFPDGSLQTVAAPSIDFLILNSGVI